MESSKKHHGDSEVFADAMAGVQPLKPDNRIPAQIRKPSARPLQREPGESSALLELLEPELNPAELGTGEELLFLRHGYSPKLLRRLRRGQYRTSDTIDLHSLSEREATQVLLRFLADANRAGNSCVHIVHGKGLRSRGLPILKLLTQRLLCRHPAVVAFVSCLPADGGTGAVRVLLKTVNPDFQ